MAQIIPIRGIRYTSSAGDMSRLIAPPYDVVSESQQKELLGRHPNNALHLELPEGAAGRYGAAAEALRSWIDGGVLARDPEPMFYVYEQAFREGGVEHRRRCLLAGVEAQPWEEGAVKPHEYTMSGPKDDRLRLLEAAQVQFSPLLMIARDRAGQLREFIEQETAREPDQEGVVAGESHRLWATPGDSFSKRRLAPLNSESFYIADGHHRYETAVTYKAARLEADPSLDPAHPARFVLAGVVAAGDPDLVIRPIHRVIDRPPPTDWRATIQQVFDIEPVAAGANPAATARELLDSRPGAIIGAGLEAGSLLVLSVRDRAAVSARTPGGHSDLWANLQPNVVRYSLLEPLWGLDDEDLRAGAVQFTHDEHEALATISAPAAGVTFLIGSIAVDDVLTLADAGERLPQKSTFFHPKLGTGMVFHPLDG